MSQTKILSLTSSKGKKKNISKDSKVIPSSNVQNLYSLYTSEFASLNSSNLKYYLESSRKGLNFWKSLLFEYIRRIDLRIAAVCQTRKLSVLGKTFSIGGNGETKNYAEMLVTKFQHRKFFTDL